MGYKKQTKLASHQKQTRQSHAEAQEGQGHTGIVVACSQNSSMLRVFLSNRSTFSTVFALCLRPSAWTFQVVHGCFSLFLTKLCQGKMAKLRKVSEHTSFILVGLLYQQSMGLHISISPSVTCEACMESPYRRLKSKNIVIALENRRWTLIQNRHQNKPHWENMGKRIWSKRWPARRALIFLSASWHQKN